MSDEQCLAILLVCFLISYPLCLYGIHSKFLNIFDNFYNILKIKVALIWTHHLS